MHSIVKMPTGERIKKRKTSELGAAASTSASITQFFGSNSTEVRMRCYVNDYALMELFVCGCHKGHKKCHIGHIRCVMAT